MRVREHVVLDLVREGQAQVTLAKHGFGLAVRPLANAGDRRETEG